MFLLLMCLRAATKGVVGCVQEPQTPLRMHKVSCSEELSDLQRVAPLLKSMTEVLCI